MAKSISFVIAIGLAWLVSVSELRAQISYAENFAGLYKDEQPTAGSNSQYNNREVVWRSPVYVRVRDLADVSTFVGLEDVPPTSNPKITSDSVPARSGDAEDGVLHFSFSAGINAFSEQRFSLSSDYLGQRPGVTEFWLQYDQFIPSNYRERSVDGHWGAKVLALYGDDYGRTRLILGRDAINNDGSSYQTGDWRFYEQDGSTRYTTFRNNSPLLVNVFKDRGKWQRRTLQVKLPTNGSAADGITKFWVRHGDGSVDQLVDVTNGEFYAYNGDNFIANGYILGWSNPGFAEDTNILIDNVIIAESISSIDETAISPSAIPSRSPVAR